MKIRQFLIKLDKTRTTDHFPFILGFRLEHGRLESTSISRETTNQVKRSINFSAFFLAEFGGCCSATCDPDQVD
ncbi:calcium-transporting ATPase 12 [Pyrus ussuriensis x Pyrus communis]|uniref:Calcium-transporting ATPase 12 n=1 Tax=Pyrus ussuriensis x Pyrus communis TaxID=2448454 RepID=A0A5N5HTR8_9ROSA|nr:calcium-transporting ATPase 12 [Pyrus ussuriensis x Pyrus communis]